MIELRTLALAAALIAPIALDAHAEGEKKGPPFADKPKEEKQPKPEVRSWTVVQETQAGKFAFTFQMKPGIPDPGQVTEVTITANALPARPDPVYGSQVPLIGARLIAELTNPAGELVGRYRAHALPLSKGRFALHLTPSQDGIYRIAVKGKSAKGEELSAEVKLPVKVWPLPEELQGSGQEAGSGSRRAIKL